ncbi:hypothetical protein AGMMS50293_13870 [Spirochaetia bacterium]|nr:hypothetical protein AGMMS50293_13870 [Spirochaetia bacterium]
MEAAPCCIARASWEEAFRLCEAYRGGGYGDWELASSGELVELLRCGRHGACVDLSSPGWHWAGEQAQKAGVPVKDRAAAVSFWGPSGYWGNTAGHCEIADIANAYAVRPVRRF